MEHNQETDKKSDFYLSSLLKKFWIYILSITDIRHGTDEEGTVQGIIRDIEFKGHNIWILVASVFIASLGLNMNSTAVVIGAMLISPLMGPILGIGLSVGTFDFKILTKSLRNLAIAVIISVLTSTVYFIISPLEEVTSELLGRTQPTIFDVFIALFGGFAGIIAGSRREKNNVIPGVAIATALMPPLCTAGYGLANGNMRYFLGAFYLFFINSVFIFLATFLVVRFLNFKKKTFVDPVWERKVRAYLSLFVLVTIIPSVIIGYRLVQTSVFQSRSTKFISENMRFENIRIVNTTANYHKLGSTIEVTIIGSGLSPEVIASLESRLIDYELKNTKLKIYQPMGDASMFTEQINKDLRIGIIEELYKRNEIAIENKGQRIQYLEKELLKYQLSGQPFEQISKEVKIQYPNISRISIGRNIVADLDHSKYDTLNIAMVTWKNRPTRDEPEKLRKWLTIRLDLDSLSIINY